MTFHPDCTDCCARGLCHWCLQPLRQAHEVQWKGYTYRACGAHVKRMVDMALGKRSPNATFTADRELEQLRLPR